MIKYEFLKVTPTYTGGGFYVIDGALKNGLFFVASPSDGFTEILDADGSEKDNNGDQVMYDSEWIELHRVNTLVDGNDNDSFMCDLCEWIITNSPDGDYALSDIKKIHSDYLNSQKAGNYGNLEYDEIDVGGPIDALINWFMNLAMTDKQHNRDEFETPCNASGICISLGEIAKRALMGCEKDVCFYVSIKLNDGDILWEVSDQAAITPDTDEIYKIIIQGGDPFLYRTYAKKTVIIEEHYCNTSDMTFLTKCSYHNDEVLSQEVIGFYYGHPNEIDTELYSKLPHMRG